MLTRSGPAWSGAAYEDLELPAQAVHGLAPLELVEIHRAGADFLVICVFAKLIFVQIVRVISVYRVCGPAEDHSDVSTAAHAHCSRSFPAVEPSVAAAVSGCARRN